MSKNRVKVSSFAHFYTWLFLLGLTLWPLIAPAIHARRENVPFRSWFVAIGLVVIMLVLFLYAKLRCSSENLSYWDGLLTVSASMMTGWVYNTMVILFPALLYTFVSSIYFAIISELRRKPDDARLRYHKFVYNMYQNRMRQ